MISVGIGPALRASLERLGVKSSGPLFGKFYFPDYASHQWKLACRRVRIEDVSFHGIRKSFASWLAQSGCRPFALRDLMGHASVTTTDRYYVGIPQEHLLKYASALTPLTSSVILSTVEEMKRLPSPGDYLVGSGVLASTGSVAPIGSSETKTSGSLPESR